MNTVTFYTTSFRGIGPITHRQLQEAFGPALDNVQTFRVRDYDITRFPFTGPVDDLFRLGTTEDLFYWIATRPLTGSKKDLTMLQSTLRSAHIEAGLALHRQTSGGKKRPTFRVIAQAESAPWRAYRRLQMQQAVERGIHQHYPRWKPVADNATLEFWVQQADKQALIGLRLSDRTMRHRTYKTASLPGSLRPTIARALVYLSTVDPNDTFLDPLCGAGTILIERALAGRYKHLLGGDIQQEAVRHTLTNFGNRHKPRKIRRWNATRLPLNAESVNKVVSNLPWGRQIGSPNENQTLYTGVLKETDRVLKPAGRAVFLTGAWNLFKKTLRTFPTLKLTEHLQHITVLGRQADIFVLEKNRT